MEDPSYHQTEPLKERGATTRRGFFKWAIGVLSVFGGLTLGIPLLRGLTSSPPKRKGRWSSLGEISSLPEGRPVDVKFESLSNDAYHYVEAIHSVWAVKHPNGMVTAFSPVCPHLGCHYLWNPGRDRFECPCHASVFSIDGRVLYGPAPRPLDTLPVKIENGLLYVRRERFKVGIPEKVVISG
jgi:quinol---cytochrome c reductase iron-sulfur subunit, bacillus type